MNEGLSLRICENANRRTYGHSERQTRNEQAGRRAPNVQEDCAERHVRCADKSLRMGKLARRRPQLLAARYEVGAVSSCSSDRCVIGVFISYAYFYADCTALFLPRFLGDELRIILFCIQKNYVRKNKAVFVFNNFVFICLLILIM